MEKTITLNNGVTMPTLGFGVFQVPDSEQCETVVREALRQGYRLIDTAAAYLNEEAVGRAIKASGIPREEIFVTTKLWVQDASYAGAQRAIDRSLSRLGLDYLDLYLIHQPLGDVYGAWRAMEEAYHAGKVRAIGVSNFEPDRVQDLMMHNSVKPAVDQIQVNPLAPQTAAVDWLLANDIRPEAWGPFAEGKTGLFTNPVLVQLADKYHKTTAQIMLRWLNQRGVVVIPKSVTPARIAGNTDFYDITLTAAEVAQIAALALPDSQFGNSHDPENVKQLGSWTLDI
ncbi:aldo/keto reductase [Levilactobacillus acidifarinae]|uniref:2,5 diketo-d-gluconic acid-like reductase, nadp dependent, (Promiscuous) n=1 Tax=Levilactobacillus acidifarinae DSM 19394 = JCM 15949 TaxID=1423715 RepID=A0A0R1LJP5_9LACO|nr:aldo/keto reductase [Levilactobacillus acidifarinae]KRK96005.1 2,5 diketo-d-gluconic acid-like reductase, nadp dependent, (promiscuous) [Levilactobacillus acidifarinae DSM 19394]GEO69309.1 aldo/keto reductase [Levilactobacillus acidifarinae]